MSATPSLFDDGDGDPAAADDPAPQMPAFANPVSHAHDPPTSAAAAAMVTESGTRGRHARVVLALVAAHPGSTAIELMAAQSGPAPLGEYQIRRRLVDLEAANLVAKGAARPCRVRGTRMVTWVAPPPAPEGP